jgi:diaminopimelate epimerase
MQFEFYKIQATGNDFVVTDFNTVPPEIFDPENIKKICDRHFGIGADGFIALEQVEGVAFRFHYYNADGSRGELCANGCRAAISYAREQGWIEQDSNLKFLADDGEHCGKYSSQDKIQINLRVSKEAEKVNIDLYNLPTWIKAGYFLDTGVPHLVLVCDSGLKQKPIEKYGKLLRFHKDFGPEGTNVNFVELNPDASIFVRTFERGVEKETLSCGTGITASAIIANKIKKKPLDKIKVLSKGGELTVLTSNGQIHILGPAKIVFKGHIQI